MSDAMTLQDAVRWVSGFEEDQVPGPSMCYAINVLLAHAERTLAVQEGEPNAVTLARRIADGEANASTAARAAYGEMVAHIDTLTARLAEVERRRVFWAQTAERYYEELGAKLSELAALTREGE